MLERVKQKLLGVKKYPVFPLVSCEESAVGVTKNFIQILAGHPFNCRTFSLISAIRLSIIFGCAYSPTASTLADFRFFSSLRDHPATDKTG